MSVYKKRPVRKYARKTYIPRALPYGKYNEDFYASIQVNGTLLASSGTIPN